MPKVWEQLVDKFKSQGMSGDKPYAIATSALQKGGVLKKGSRELTKKGEAMEAGKPKPKPKKKIKKKIKK